MQWLAIYKLSDGCCLNLLSAFWSPNFTHNQEPCRKMPFKREKKSSSQKLILDTSDLVLTVVKDAARLAPVPYLQDAATLALGIMNIIQVSSFLRS